MSERVYARLASILVGSLIENLNFDSRMLCRLTGDTALCSQFA